MPKRAQMVRHSQAQADLYVGLPGQITVNQTNNTIRVHDGSNAGGHETALASLANVSAATSGSDGKMSSTQAANLTQVISDLDDLEVLVSALNADDIAFDDTGLLVTAETLQAAIAAYDALITAMDGVVDAHVANVANPHAVTAAQAGALAIVSNLEDVDDASTAVTNLGIDPEADADWTAGTSTTKQTTSPAKIRLATKSYLNREAGEIVVLGYDGTIAGLLRCDGTAVSRVTHAPLFSKIGTTFGVGDGSTTFNLPNIVKKFMLGSEDSSVDGYDIGETGGNFEITQTGDQVGNHGHMYRHSTDTENQAAAGDGGILVTKRAAAPGSPINRAAYAGVPDNTTGHAIGQNQAQAAVDPMDITNPFIAMPVYITTGGV